MGSGSLAEARPLILQSHGYFVTKRQALQLAATPETRPDRPPDDPNR